MHAQEQAGTTRQASFIEEFQQLWGVLINRWVFVGLLGAWALIFHFIGHCQFNLTDKPSLFIWMWRAWDTPSFDSSHGKIIPFVVLGILWYKRQELLASVKGYWWPALLPLAFAALLQLLAFFIQQPRLSIIGMSLGIYSLVGLVWGWKTMKASFFPFFLLVFCVPLGTFIEPLTFSLRLLATTITAFVTQDVLGIPVVRNGTQLFDAARTYNYDVGAACSGIRSLFALLAITTIFAMLLFKANWRRGLMIIYTVPLAIFCNVLRLIAIILAAQAFGPGAGNFIHEWFGFVTYAVSIGGVLLLARLLREETVSPPKSLDLESAPSADKTSLPAT